MPPNPSKVMAPVQMQSSPSQVKSRDKITDFVTNKSNGKEKANRGKTRANISKERSGQASPKAAPSVQRNDSVVSGQSPQSTRVKSASPLKSGQSYNGRKSISPDGSYAGAKFSEAPPPDRLPMPPKHWLRSISAMSAGKNVEKTRQKAYVSCSGESGFEKITRDLKMMLKVES